MPPAATPANNPLDGMTNSGLAAPRAALAPTGVPSPILPPMPPPGQSVAQNMAPSPGMFEGQKLPGNPVRNLTPPPEMASAGGPAPEATAPFNIPFSTSVPAGAGPSSAPAAPAAPPNPTETLIQTRFTAFMDAVRKKLDEGKYAEAQLVLSSFYGNPDLSARSGQTNHRSARPACRHGDLLAATLPGTGLHGQAGRHARKDRPEVPRALAIAGADQRPGAARRRSNAESTDKRPAASARALS